jgi:cell wall-associated NlpC family hydrolase
VRTAPVVVALLLSACSSLPQRPQPSGEAGAAIASSAAALVGTPYHFGGADAAGFDCSGLARYVHERAGLAIPRTAAAQEQSAHRVPISEMALGDLVFFSLGSRGVDHVGVYAGAGRFIHARRAGLAVAYGDLGSGGYYARHLVSVGRFWEAPRSRPR